MAYNVNQELIEKLKERLKWYYGEATEEEFDADEVDAICTLLDKLEPEEEESEDMETVYENLMARIRKEETEKENAENLLIGNEEALDKLKTWIQEEETEEDSEDELFRDGYADDKVIGKKRKALPNPKTETDDVTDRAFGRKYEAVPDNDIENGSSDEKDRMISDRESEETDSKNISGPGKVRPFKKAKREKNRKTKAGIRVAAILVIGVLGAGILAVNNQMQTSANKSLLTMIMEKVGIVYVDRLGESKGKVDDLEDDKQQVYSSWSDLDSEIKSKIVVPKYIPKGFSLYNLKCQVLENKTVIWADYYNNTGGAFDI